MDDISILMTGIYAGESNLPYLRGCLVINKSNKDRKSAIYTDINGVIYETTYHVTGSPNCERKQIPTVEQVNVLNDERYYTLTAISSSFTFESTDMNSLINTMDNNSKLIIDVFQGTSTVYAFSFPKTPARGQLKAYKTSDSLVSLEFIEQGTGLKWSGE